MSIEEEEEITVEEEVVEENQDNDPAEDAVDTTAIESTETSSAGVYNSMTVNDKVFEELRLAPDLALEIQVGWKHFVSSAESREAAGEALYSAFFDAAPSLQSLFKTPRAIMSMRLMLGFSSIFGSLNDPKGLKVLVETLGF